MKQDLKYGFQIVYVLLLIFLCRQLLTGVANLHVIASTLENLHRIQDRTGDFLTELDDDDDDTGPAL
jgi:hypothetical protein